MRYAIYHTPDHDDPLTVAAAAWLCRDAFGQPAAAVDLPAAWTNERHLALVADARRYGFHATLKAPFHLADGVSEAELLAAFDRLELAHECVEIPSLALRQIDGFFALVPDEPDELLNELTGLLVREFDRFRAPLTQSDIDRRNPGRLSESQRLNLERWGYPYVFDDFFFHMTLTGRVHGDDADEVRSRLEAWFAPFLGKPHPVSHIAVFVEPVSSGDFEVLSIRPAHGRAINRKT